MQRPVWCKVDEVLYITGHCAPIEGKGEHQDHNCSHLKMTKLLIKRFHPCMVAPSSSPSVHGSTCSSGVRRNDNPIIPAAGKRKARLAITCNHRSKLLSLAPLLDYALGVAAFKSPIHSTQSNPESCFEFSKLFYSKPICLELFNSSPPSQLVPPSLYVLYGTVMRCSATYTSDGFLQNMIKMLLKTFCIFNRVIRPELIRWSETAPHVNP